MHVYMYCKGDKKVHSYSYSLMVINKTFITEIYIANYAVFMQVFTELDFMVT